ncbi:C40 family peptidase [Aeromicrobium marinum]|uniref:C40 family peptidase n=1 Tax=Aeromicrobium marinum TaxID=219314 RepID=UPI0012EA8F66|nr:C40 family peptidase [Aeromicrobium marinum]
MSTTRPSEPSSTTSTARPARSRLAAGAAALGLVAALLTVGAAVAEPDRAATVAEVEQAFERAEAANEQVNQLGVQIERTQADIAALDAEISAVGAEYEQRRTALGEALVEQQLAAPLGPTVSLLGSEDPEAFLEGLGAVQALNTSRAEALDEFSAVSRKLQNRRAQLEDLRTTLEADEASADEIRKDVQAQYRAAQAALERLPAEERRTLTASNTTIDFAVVAPSARGQAAIDFALAQVGKPYVYGGTGPNGYDCSGLVQASFRAAGASIPRVVGPQYQAAQQISMDQLQPGDIVFYGDMSHNGIYLGDGRVVHAPRPGKTVEITGMGGFTKAARVG